MPFDLGSAQDVEEAAPPPTKRKFDLATAQDVPEPRGMLGRATDAVVGYGKDYVSGISDVGRRVHEGGAPEKGVLGDALDAVKDALQGSASFATQVAAPVAALPRLALNRAGLTNAPDETYLESRDRFTYTPEDSGARAVSETPGAIIKPLGDVLRGAGKGLSAAAKFAGADDQTVADVEQAAPDVIGLGLGARAVGKAAARGPIAAGKLGGPKSAPPVTLPASSTPVPIANTPEQVARGAGLKILPSQAQSAPVGTVAETLAGSPRLAKALSKANATQVQALLVEELGLPKGSKLTPEQFAQLREPLNAAYKALSENLGPLKADAQLKSAIAKVGGQKGLTTNRQVARLREQYSKLGELPAAELVQEIRSLREKASSNLKTPFGVKDRVSLKELGKAQQEVANALDDMLERGANASGRSDLVKGYKEARVGLAKIGTVERAVQAPSGPAQSLAKQQNKGAPLTGRLKILAESARAFPEVMGKPAVQTGLEGTIQTSLDVLTGGLRPLVSKAIVNRALQSDAYQNTIGRAAPVLGPGSSLGAYFDDGRSGLSPRGPTGPAPADVGPPTAPLRLPAPGDVPLAVNVEGRAGPVSEVGGLADSLGLTPGSREVGVADARTGRYSPPPATGPQPRPLALPAPGDIPLTGLTGQGPLLGPLDAQSLAAELGLTDDIRAIIAKDPRSAARAPAPELLPSDPSIGPVKPKRANPRIGPPKPPLGLPAPGDVPLIGTADGQVGTASEISSLIEELGLTESLRAITARDPRSAGYRGPAAPAEEVLPTDPAPVPGNSGASLVDDLLSGDPGLLAELRALVNNASGESSASVEAINRVASEKAAGQSRYLIDADGTVTPLVGVDAVDAVARPGQVIVQRGVGAEPYTVLDRGGTPAAQLKGIIARARGDLDSL